MAIMEFMDGRDEDADAFTARTEEQCITTAAENVASDRFDCHIRYETLSSKQ